MLWAMDTRTSSRMHRSSRQGWPRCARAPQPARIKIRVASRMWFLAVAVALVLPLHVSAAPTPSAIVCTPSKTWSVFLDYATPDEANHIEYDLNGAHTVQVSAPRLLGACLCLEHHHCVVSLARRQPRGL